MDKYPVFREEQTVGELTVAPDALYTAFSVSCRKTGYLSISRHLPAKKSPVHQFMHRRILI